jgi:hypothetical protein
MQNVCCARIGSPFGWLNPDAKARVKQTKIRQKSDTLNSVCITHTRTSSPEIERNNNNNFIEKSFE